MSAILLCGKRSYSVFDELLYTTPPSSSKRSRCCPSRATSPADAAALSSPSFYSPSSDHKNITETSGIGGGAIYSTPFDHLQSIFPDMDPQILELALKASGNDLDSAIKRLQDLRLESAEGNTVSAFSKSDTGTATNVQPGGIMSDAGGQVSEISPVTNILPASGSEWVELFVREMRNAPNLDDARARASRLLEIYEKTIMDSASDEAVQKLNEENTILKQQIEVFLRDNAVLKRAVAIQHERQKECDEKNQELHHFKQLASQLQEQMRTAEMNNYALKIHLQQAQQSSSIPGRFHPDIF